MYVGRVEEKRERSGLWVPECVCVLVGSRDGGGSINGVEGTGLSEPAGYMEAPRILFGLIRAMIR